MSNKTEIKWPKQSSGVRGKPFIVRCEKYRCMAYRDGSGKWRDFFNDDEIVGEVTVMWEA